MMLLALLMGGVGLILLGRFAARLAVHAGPLFAGAAAGGAFHAHGVDLAAAIGLGVLVAISVLALAHLLMQLVRSSSRRVALAALFAGPAAFAGYHLLHGVAALLLTSEMDRQLLGLVGGAMAAASAWAQMIRPMVDHGAAPEPPLSPEPPTSGPPTFAPHRR
ncbi:hypothetical protein [Phenylobacterium sp.]|uniref:hypothetical protein n=1 Tax=Phenylobacterium sp. TaxID=1871053 RepID=UPI0035B24A15